MKTRFLFLWCCTASVLGASSCAKEIGGDLPASATSGPMSGDGAVLADSGTAVDPLGNVKPGTKRVFLDAGPTGDAFFAMDPQPAYCGPEESRPALETVTGDARCPSDKNREGCPCLEPGATAACWPGKRVHRNHGVCKDGTTVCRDSTEFGLRWAPCEGYVLPEEGAVAGPKACGCFSAGTWSLTNLSPCIQINATTNKTYLYSSLRTLNADGSLNCGASVAEPPPVPTEVWSGSMLNVDCSGQFTLCYTIKAGNVKDPLPGDCTVVQTCEDVWYAESGKDQTLADLPAWSSPNSDCARQFVDRGGYGEMSVIGTSIDCDRVDDGKGGALVFHRVSYCKPSCRATPNDPGCADCRTGGSGDF